MRELSLHIIDLVENALAAGARHVRVCVGQDRPADLLRIAVEDDGRGWAVDGATAVDPFHTTKSGARTGLGLALMEAAARAAGGHLALERSTLGGAAVTATFRLGAVDRSPLGDLAGSLAAMTCVEPGVTIECEISVDDRTVRVATGPAGAGTPRAGNDTERCTRGSKKGCVWSERRSRRLELRPGSLARSGSRDAGGRAEMEEGMTSEIECRCGESASEQELLARVEQTDRDLRDKPGALIPALQIAQGIFGSYTTRGQNLRQEPLGGMGKPEDRPAPRNRKACPCEIYLPRAALQRVADGLGLPLSEVTGVVTFYSYFSTVPRGCHVVRVCLGTACYVRGGKAVLDALRARLKIDVGETTADRTFSLQVARCFGACGLAPAVMIDETVYHRVRRSPIGGGGISRAVMIDETVYHRVEPTRVAQMLKRHVERHGGGAWKSELRIETHRGSCGSAHEKRWTCGPGRRKSA